MGVNTDISTRDRRSLPLSEENGPAKRFKPSPMLVSKDEASLKIRISRYGTAPGRSQATKNASPDKHSQSPARSSGSQGSAINGGSPRLGRASAVVPSEVKKEETPPSEIKFCEVRVSNISSIKSENTGPLDDDNSSSSTKADIRLNINPRMTASEIFDECESNGNVDGEISTSLSDDWSPPKRRVNLPKLNPSQLLPATPCVHVKNKQEAFSPQLLDWCLQRPITVIRGLPQVCDMDLSLYTTRSLVETQPNHPVEVRTQLEQSSDENWEPSLKEQVWYCTSSRSHTTISKYAEYLSTSYKEAKEKLGPEFSVNPKLDLKTDPETGFPVRKTIKFGTNCDLSDEKKWGPQIKELMKLPCWLRVVSAGNMLSHVGHQILGMNTIQLYMKVPRSRTPGHQENNNFAAVNINIGPGDSEWFGVPDEYWGPLQELCEKKQVDYLHGSWWPKMEDLKEAEIPCYRFMQRPGEVVFVNTGCVHWVQAAGWCNNVAWNTGPLTYRQYVAAIERYEWNKTQRYQSIVAMAFLTWNMARNIQVSDVNLFLAMKRTMMHTLRQTALMRKFAMKMNVPIRYHGRGPNDPVNYCMICEEEVFNVFFVKANEKRHVVHCLRCARLASKDLAGWICLEEYELDELKTVFDDFKVGDCKQTPGNPLQLSMLNNNQPSSSD